MRETSTGDTSANVCDSLIWHGTTYTASINTPTHISTNAVGCDSVISYCLHVWRNVSTQLNSTICDDLLPLTWNSHTFGQAGTQNRTLTTSHGADSTIYCTLYVNPTYNDTITATICDKFSFSFGDSVYTTSGIFTDTLRSILGCDSLSTLHLVVFDIYEQLYFDTICYNMTYNWRGHTVHGTADNLTESFILHDTLVSVYGCDSVDILTLTKMALPQITLLADTDCAIPGYRLSALAYAPLSSDTPPSPMPWLHWTSVPVDNSLSGHEGMDFLSISPLTTTKYILYADYHKTPLCPITDSITLPRIIAPQAILKANPTTLSMDNLHFVAQDKTTSHLLQRSWYLDGILYPSTSAILEDDANPEADSVVIGLEVYNGQCRDTAKISLNIYKVVIYAPNVFTPSKESNNLFRLVTRGIIDCELFIFDRLGNLVFYTTDLSEGWDGTHNGQPCQQRAYVWKVIFRTIDQPDSYQTKTGTITLIR